MRSPPPATERVMADFSCASTKRTSHWPAPMSWEAPLRFRVSVVVAALVLTGCNANQEVNLSSRRPPESSPARTTILTIPSATHRTTPGTAALAVEAGAVRLPAETVPRRQISPRPAPRSPALGARQAPSHDGSGEGVGLWIDHATLAPLQRAVEQGDPPALLASRGRALTPPASIDRTPPHSGTLARAVNYRAETFVSGFLGPSRPPQVHVRAAFRCSPLRCQVNVRESLLVPPKWIQEYPPPPDESQRP